MAPEFLLVPPFKAMKNPQTQNGTSVSCVPCGRSWGRLSLVACRVACGDPQAPAKIQLGQPLFLLAYGEPTTEH